MKTIVVIGNGSMAVNCLKIMGRYSQARVALVIADPMDVSLMFLRQFCQAEGLDLELSGNVNSADSIAKLRSIAPQVIFNINSFQILREELIAIPGEAIINFHNGPLPRYRGINVCSWAIMNGEKRYGVTWHVVEKGVDSGDIVAQRFFDLSETETAFSLIIKCIKEGTVLFEEIFPLFLEGNVPRERQDQALATLYTRKDIPNDGFVDYGWNYEKFDSFIRGLSFGPMQNPFVHPKSIVNSIPFFIRKISRCEGPVPETLEPGSVFGIGERGIDVKLKDSAVTITDVLNSETKPIRIRAFIEKYRLEVGNQMKSC